MVFGVLVDAQLEDPTSMKFTWKIDNFTTLNTRNVYSDIFVVGGYKWYPFFLLPRDRPSCRNWTYKTEVSLLFFLVDWILNCFGLFDQEYTNISKGKQQCGLVFHLLSCCRLWDIAIRVE